MKGKDLHMRLTKLFLVLLAAGLLVWGVQGVALGQSYPADYNQASDSSGRIHTDSEGQFQMSPSAVSSVPSDGSDQESSQGD